MPIPEMNLNARLHATDRQVVALHIPPDSALVEFVRFDVVDFKAVPAWDQPRWRAARYLAFVLIAGHPDSVQMIDLGLAKPIDDMISTFRRSITGESDGRGSDGRCSPESAQTDVQDRLRQVLFDPLRNALGGKIRLLLAPDGELSQIPFEALPLRNGRFLIDDYQISYLGTGRDALRLGAPAFHPSAMPIVAAYPDFNLASPTVTVSPSPAPPSRLSRGFDVKTLAFTPLPATQKEGERIAAMLAIEPWLGGTVVEGRVKGLRSPRILHLATHGFFLPDQPVQHRRRELTETDRQSGAAMENPMLRSFLVLAGAETWRTGGNVPPEAEDGILTAEDVSGMDLMGTDLVVLSACDTGRGEVRQGEGVFGLRRAFTIAGAKTLVMSLWTVPDKLTGELMEEFYRRIKTGEPRAEALRAAQLDMKSRNPDPFFWAGFICQGEPGPMYEIVKHEAESK